ncbi:MAG: MerR family transcriptional regulator [Micropepsaceae bacterium]
MTKAGDNAAAFAARFGVTVKALRVYEREGLLKPARSGANWRAYGRAEEERLTAILALKRLGLPLARVRELLSGFKGDLNAVLALQEQSLSRRQAELGTALAIVQAARARLEAGQALTADDLTQLVRTTAMTETTWTPEMQSLAEKHYTQAQLDDLRARKFDMNDQQAIAAEWAQIFADGERLRLGDPAAPEAQVWAARWKAATDKFTQGRQDLWDSAAKFNAEARTNPQTAPQMPGSPEVWAFASKAMKILLGNKS